MILVDTSVWLDHFHRVEPRLVDALGEARVGTHAGVIGELALGSLKHRGVVLEHLGNLPTLPQADPSEVLWMVERHALFGRGLVWVDANLLASLLITPGWSLWTRDKRLATAAAELGLRGVQP